MKNKGLPPLSFITRRLGVDSNQFYGPKRTLISIDLLRVLLQHAVRNAPFDEQWYLSQNPDVAQALREGRISSAHEHFISAGYFENRLGALAEFDENWYIGKYEDVAKAVKSGKLQSGYAHYQSSGRAEGRAANSGQDDTFNYWSKLIQPERA